MMALLAAIVAAFALSGCGGGEDDDSSHGAELRDRTFVSSGGGTADGPPVDAPITVEFEEQGGETVLRWRATCNSFSANVEITADRLLVADEVAATQLGCASQDAYAEDEWLSAFFGSDPDWRLSGERLDLTADETTIELKAQNAG
jgi:heat shock protein HslJ